MNRLQLNQLKLKSQKQSKSKEASYTQAQLQKLAEAEMALEQAFERWEQLENIKNGNL